MSNCAAFSHPAHIHSFRGCSIRALYDVANAPSLNLLDTQGEQIVLYSQRHNLISDSRPLRVPSIMSPPDSLHRNLFILVKLRAPSAALVDTL